ncbi:DUF5701 family protein [Cellulomonas massiliensis]|uniref:DUF5701 family protein n=1 Tax=Cellulomonas massiliensis TaxID=1465811 RepID=UPI0002F9EEBA|nr:DUF5701 family protein [Cellulomonas massiliensis]
MPDAAALTTPSAPAATLSPLPPLPSLPDQADRLVALGVHELAGLAPAELRDAARALAGVAERTHPGRRPGGTLLVVDHRLAPASALAPLLRRGERPGFVVEDMTDVDAFVPADGVTVPDGPLLALVDVERGDELANASPAEAQATLDARGRTPMLLTEGVHWALQAPAVLERNRCYMTIGSRVRRPDGRYDARTPAVWISNGTGRDGRDAPKVGWCWWNNRHTWLGFGSAAARVAAPL